MATSIRVRLKKMPVEVQEPVLYSLRLDNGSSEDGVLLMNDLLGKQLKISYEGEIRCLHCNQATQKSFQGYCYKDFQRLACCDQCQMSPELCHYDKGSCREPDWGKEFCFSPHSVYLARSSGVKVGITRENPALIRWIDQGAIEGMVIATVPDRKTSGLLERALALHLPDRTNFRTMLTGPVCLQSLEEVYETVADYVPMSLQDYLLPAPTLHTLHYPILRAPAKVNALSLDKNPVLDGRFMGIKGQYLIFEDFVFNLRAHSGYMVQLEMKD